VCLYVSDYVAVTVDVGSPLCSCMQSAGLDWPTKCFHVS